VRVLRLDPDLQELVILNEQSGRFDDYADAAGTRIGAAFGSWQPASGGWARLRSESLDLEWSQPALPGAVLVGAHEVIPPGIDFSGLEYVFTAGLEQADYEIQIRRAR
jgi:hypothetical protein